MQRLNSLTVCNEENDEDLCLSSNFDFSLFGGEALLRNPADWGAPMYPAEGILIFRPILIPCSQRPTCVVLFGITHLYEFKGNCSSIEELSQTRKDSSLSLQLALPNIHCPDPLVLHKPASFKTGAWTGLEDYPLDSYFCIWPCPSFIFDEAEQDLMWLAFVIPGHDIFLWLA